MRDGEEFYLEEAKGILASLLVEIAGSTEFQEKRNIVKIKERLQI